MKNLEWKSVAKEWAGSCFPLTTLQAVLGTGEDGKEYLVRCKYYAPKNSFMVEFDNSDEETDSPFLRDRVLDAPSFWDARREYYNMKYTSYAGVTRVIKDFAESKGIAL